MWMRLGGGGAKRRGAEAAHRSGELLHGEIGLGGGAPPRGARQCSAQQCVGQVTASVGDSPGNV